jgi:hypothetical protein
MQGSDDCFQTLILANTAVIVAFFNMNIYMFQKSELYSTNRHFDRNIRLQVLLLYDYIRLDLFLT